MKKKIYFNLFFCLFLLFLIFTLWAPVLHASDLTGSSFIVRDPVIGTGGGYASSGTFRMFQSLDESVIGIGDGSIFIGHYGFLYFPFLEDEEEVVEEVDGGGGGGGMYGFQCGRIADFNCDTHVDIFDLSILLFYIEENGQAFPPYDLSEDGVFDLKDISILFYYWDE